MLFWMIDNVALVLTLLCAVALCFGAAWWINRQSKLLIGCAVPAGLMAMAWLLAVYVDTDRKQLVRNIETMRDLVNADKLADISQFFADDFDVVTANGVQPFTKDAVETLAKINRKAYGVKEFVVNNIDVEQVARPAAKVTFVVGPEDVPVRALCRMEFVLSADGKWRIRKVGIESYPGGQKSDQLIFPF